MVPDGGRGHHNPRFGFDAIAKRYPPRQDIDLDALADMAATLVEGGLILFAQPRLENRTTSRPAGASVSATIPAAVPKAPRLHVVTLDLRAATVGRQWGSGGCTRVVRRAT
jgi:hypothetical protein